MWFRNTGLMMWCFWIKFLIEIPKINFIKNWSKFKDNFEFFESFICKWNFYLYVSGSWFISNVYFKLSVCTARLMVTIIWSAFASHFSWTLARLKIFLFSQLLHYYWDMILVLKRLLRMQRCIHLRSNLNVFELVRLYLIFLMKTKHV